MIVCPGLSPQEQATFDETERAAQILESMADRNPAAEILEAAVQVVRGSSRIHWKALKLASQ